jgi:hypothetical protein
VDPALADQFPVPPKPLYLWPDWRDELHMHPVLGPNLGLERWSLPGCLNQNETGPKPLDELTHIFPKLSIACPLPPLIKQKIVFADRHPRLDDRTGVRRSPLLTRVDAQDYHWRGRQNVLCESGEVLALDAQVHVTARVLLIQRLIVPAFRDRFDMLPIENLRAQKVALLAGPCLAIAELVLSRPPRFERLCDLAPAALLQQMTSKV